MSYYDDGIVRLVHGDAIEALRELEAESVDAIVTDPPYELAFMGKGWDTSGIAFQTAVWSQCLRVLKPGGHLLAFGGTRTYHRMVVAIEDAGFEIRDCLVWAYASGFPKSLDVSKAIDKAAGVNVSADERWKPEPHPVTGAYKTSSGRSEQIRQARPGLRHVYAPADAGRPWHGWGTALKPAHEPIVLARKPLIGSVAANVLAHGTGALNIDGCRIPTAAGEGDPSAERKAHGYSEAAKKALGATVASENASGFSGEVVGMDSSKGRWPANVVLTDPIFDGDYPEDVVGGGSSSSGFMSPDQERQESYGEGGYHGGFVKPPSPDGTYGDNGGKSRFFLIPKADRAERERGLTGGQPVDALGLSRGGPGEPGKESKEGYEYRPPVRANHHPTVKPIDLMRHLVRLVTPPRGLVVDPFVGSGTTALAASEEGFRCIGIDQSEEYLEIAKGRLMATNIGLGLTA